MNNEQLIHHFYTAFRDKDIVGMQACYHPEVRFNDEAFSNLQGKQVWAMWAMLVEGGKDMRITFRDIKANDAFGSATWEAFYTLSLTGNKVHNVISASFEFKDGKIINHHDRFSFYRWARQAFGITGWLVGWTPFLRQKVQKTVAQRLQKYIAQHPEYQS
ncbi:MAG: nuclear transport factor 2 family protein [Microscillaceae bacterium]|jgi:ketosteroid isomerase-like protein|nr:nuclear transport factor 2 family protein [Microscillaceae bacterium]